MLYGFDESLAMLCLAVVLLAGVAAIITGE